MKGGRVYLTGNRKQIYRLKDIQHKYGISRSSVYRLVGLGLFPKPLKIGLAAIGWDADDLAAWYAERKLDAI